ncbi:MAG TPA: lantibiotic dehydratase [Thermoanaerobaculia bacterium]|jgi:hypothetical protein|nr:lantibiotic dehydratase [Thermoanaerobaculia bacterium]
MTAERPALGSGWTLWRHALVRGAGFPFALLDDVFRSGDPSALWRVAADGRFREAVTWQNRPAVETALDGLLRRPAGTENAKTRQQQRLVAKYLQRYCAKNDTIGFFGPVGWATVGGDAQFAAGPTLLSARATFLEPWCVLALARAVDDETRLKAPVTIPGHLRLSGSKLITPDAMLTLAADELGLLRAVDGRSAAELLKRLGIDDPWRAVLERLAARGIVRWEFPVMVSLEPDRQWRTELREKRDDVARAAGDPIALGRALESLDLEFETRTKTAPRRGGTWARSLVFEECRRSISMDLGTAAVERIAPALLAVLRIARWYTFAIGTRVAAALLREHRKRVPLPVFWRRTVPIFEEEIAPAIDAVSAQFRRKWRTLWISAPVQSCARGDQQHIDVEAAGAFVGRHFRAPCPGWPGARHHAPDLMWNAQTPEELLAGNGTPVLSELHPGVTPLTTLSVLSLCPVRDELMTEWDADFPEPLVSPIPWEQFARSSQDARLAKQHWHLDIGDDFASERPPEQVLRSADFDVVADDGRLIAVQRNGGLRLDLLRVFERRIKLRAAAAFSLSDDAARTPRRCLGPLVVQRAQWRVESLPFHDCEGAATWREALGIPERVFARVPGEMKPIYVDLASPISVEMFVRFAAGAPRVSVSEMYPGPDGLWLRDGEGNAYTSEMRCIAVDPRPFDERKVWRAARSLRPV